MIYIFQDNKIAIKSFNISTLLPTEMDEFRNDKMKQIVEDIRLENKVQAARHKEREEQLSFVRAHDNRITVVESTRWWGLTSIGGAGEIKYCLLSI